NKPSIAEDPLILSFSPRGEGTVLHRTALKTTLGARNSAPSPFGERAGVRGASPKEKEIPKGECHLLYEDFLTFSEGQIVALLPPDDVFQNFEKTRQFQSQLKDLASRLKGRVYLAASCRFHGDDAKRLHRLSALARAARVPLIATNDVLYHDPACRRLQ